jgi:hypothetical protein
MLANFFSADGPKKILVYYQVADSSNGDDIKDSGAEPTLFITNGDQEKLKDKAIYFVKNFPISKENQK